MSKKVNYRIVKINEGVGVEASTITNNEKLIHNITGIKRTNNFVTLVIPNKYNKLIKDLNNNAKEILLQDCKTNKMCLVGINEIHMTELSSTNCSKITLYFDSKLKFNIDKTNNIFDTDKLYDSKEI